MQYFPASHKNTSFKIKLKTNKTKPTIVIVDEKLVFRRMRT